MYFQQTACSGKWTVVGKTDRMICQTQHWLKLGVVLVAVFGGSSCATPSGAGVPALNPDDLVEPRFEGISPRELSILITDERMPKPETSKEMVAELERALGARFRSAGFRIDNRNAVRTASGSSERF